MIIFLKSLIVGICAIMPGVSGSVIAVSLGIYELFINKIDNIKENKKILLTIVFGIISGIYLTCFILIKIINNLLVYYLLLSIILSEVPMIIKKCNKKVQIIPMIISFTFSIALSLLKSSGVVGSSPLKYFIGGILFSFGKVFPGVSSSYFLLTLGIYDNIILLIMNPFLLLQNIKLYFPFLISSIISFIIFIKIIKYLLINKTRLTYSIILGLVLSSVFTIVPEFNIFYLFISILLFIYIYRIKKTYE